MGSCEEIEAMIFDIVQIENGEQGQKEELFIYTVSQNQNTILIRV